VGVGHEQVAVADAGLPATALGAAVDRGEFAEDVVGADQQAGALALVLLVLRVLAKDGVGEDAGVRTACAPTTTPAPRRTSGPITA
jgi:hypothetical protein